MCRSLTITRIVMDEVEFRTMYNRAVDAAKDRPTECLMICLQLINSLREQVEELQLEDED